MSEDSHVLDLSRSRGAHTPLAGEDHRASHKHEEALRRALEAVVRQANLPDVMDSNPERDRLKVLQADLTMEILRCPAIAEARAKIIDPALASPSVSEVARMAVHIAFENSRRLKREQSAD